MNPQPQQPLTTKEDMSEQQNKRGRKANGPAEVIDAAPSAAASAEDSYALAVIGQQAREVAERYGDGEPYDRRRLVDEARFFLGSAAEAMLELGKRLVQIKENEPHGDFERIVTDQLGLALRSARRIMQASVKYLSPALASKRPALAVLGKTKLFDLALEDDDDLSELAEGGTLAGLNLDEMQSMSHRELRAALAEARKDKTAKDKVITEKNAKIDKLSEQLHRRASGEPAEREQAQLDLLRGDTLLAETALLRALVTVDTVMQDAATEAAELSARQALDFLVQRLVDACLSRGITVDLAERVSPIWHAPIAEIGAKGRAEMEAKAAARRGNGGAQ
ncbi:MAG TPA: DUF3102 domain-containing protein [Ottowia sp.]|nr:DUF3102 domain-containing protein [Ottowia sp.]